MVCRIVVVAACPFPARRGTPLRIERLSEALVAHGHDVEVVAYDIGEGDDPEAFPVRRTSAHRTFGTMPPGPNLKKLLFLNPRLVARVAQAIRARPVDLIHAHHYEGLLVALAARGLSGIPIVYDAHTLLASELPSYDLGLGERLARLAGAWLDGVLPRRADHVITVTPDIRERLVLEHGVDPDRADVVMNGVELEHFPVKGRPDPDRLFYSGTTAAYQRLDLLLAAFARALRARPSLRLRLSLSGPLDPLRPLVQELGIAQAIDVVRDSFEALPEELADAGVAVLPRTACDGIPQKLLNYMAAGRAVIASAGSAKVLEHGRSGLVVPNDDVEAFAQAILLLRDQPERALEMGRAARRHVETNGSWDYAAGVTGRIYQAVLAREARWDDRSFDPGQTQPSPTGDGAPPAGSGRWWRRRSSTATHFGEADRGV